MRADIRVLEENNARLVAELAQVRRDKKAVEILAEALKKRLARVTSASRSSSSVDPPAQQRKRPLPTGVIQEEKTKKLALALAPRPTSR